MSILASMQSFPLAPMIFFLACTIKLAVNFLFHNESVFYSQGKLFFKITNRFLVFFFFTIQSTLNLLLYFFSILVCLLIEKGNPKQKNKQKVLNQATNCKKGQK